MVITMTAEEKISQLEIKNAVLNEKVKRLESVIYGTLTFAFLQLVGLFLFWIKDLING